MPLAPVTTWRIHIGAHKTATTAVQEILTLMRPQLVERGVDFVDNHRVRQSGLARALFQRRLATRLPGLRGRAVAEIMARHLDPLRAGPTTFVLSEEKLMGGSLQVFSDPAYPQIERIVPMLASLRSRAEVSFFLSIRSLDGQLPSAYVQELKFSPPIEGGFDNIRARVLARPPSWFELVRRIRAAAPSVPLRVWRQEDYRRDPAAILAVLCGRDPGPLPAMDDPYWTKSPTWRRSAPPRRCRTTCSVRSGGRGCWRSSATRATASGSTLSLRRRRRRCTRPTPAISSGSRRSIRGSSSGRERQMAGWARAAARAARPGRAAQGSVSKLRPIWKKTALLRAFVGSCSRLRKR